MTKAQIFKRKAGIVLAIVGIVLSMLPAIRMSDGSKQTIYQLLMNEEFVRRDLITAEYITAIIFLIILIFGLLVHILNLLLWLRKKETTYIGVMGLSWGSFLALIMITVIGSMYNDAMFAQFPLTIWQCIRAFIILSEAIIKLSGEELYTVFFSKGE